MVTWSQRGWSFRWNRDFNLNGMMVLVGWYDGVMLGGMMVLCWVECWCYVGWNVGVMLGGMLVLCWVECWCYVGWNVGVMLGGMMV